MALFLIGIGLGSADGITIRGLELAKKADKVYLESYTGIVPELKELESLLGKKIILADRELVEQKAEKTILQAARDGDVALLVVGDPFAATTHADLVLRAKKANVRVEVVHNASIMSAIGATGLQLYKFGRTASIPFAEKDYLPETPYDILAENQKIGAHTLLLLDLRPEQKKFMTINEAIEYLLKIELKRSQKVFARDTLCVGIARLGKKDQFIKSGKAKDLLNIDFGKAPHCLVVPGSLHFVEEEFLERWK
jgi:diphthine synthase